MNADEARRICESQAILISGNRHPALIETTPYFMHRRYSRIHRRFSEARLQGGAQGVKIKRVELP